MKIRIWFLVFMLCCVLSGCNEQETAAVPYTPKEPLERVYTINEDVNEEEYAEFLEKTVSLTPSDMAEYRQQLKEMQIPYMGQEYFGVEEYLSCIAAIEPPVLNLDETNSIWDGKTVDAEALYKNTLKNNEVYAEKNAAIMGKYEETPDDTVREVCDAVAGYVNVAVVQLPEVVQHDLARKLSALVVYEYSGPAYASYDSGKGLMTVNMDTVKVLEKQNENAFLQLIAHETNHLLQADAASEYETTEYDIRFGPCYHFEELKVNSGYWLWLDEAFAEEISARLLGCDEQTYGDMIDKKNIMDSFALFDPDTYVGQLEELSFHPDVNKLFDYFSCETEQDRIEITQMLYTFNLVCLGSTHYANTGFYDLYKEKSGEVLLYSTTDKVWPCSVAQSLAKNAYIDLTKNICERTVSMEDFFATMCFVERQIVRLTRCHEDFGAEYRQELYEDYIRMQDGFVEILAAVTGVSVEKIHELFLHYCNQVTADSFAISYLDPDKEAVIKKEFEKVGRTLPSIRKMVRIVGWHTDDISCQANIVKKQEPHTMKRTKCAVNRRERLIAWEQ